MQAEQIERLVEAFAVIPDPRVQGRTDYSLTEILVMAVCAVLSGADSFTEIALWSEIRQEWLRRYLKLEHGIPSHDTFGRVFSLLDSKEFEKGFRRWVGCLLPALAEEPLIAIDGKTLRRSGGLGGSCLHLVSAFCTEVGLVLGQVKTKEKSNEKTAIPELLDTLKLKGATVSIDAMGTQPNIAARIRQRGGDYVLAVKDNQQKLHEAITEFFDTAQQEHWRGVNYATFETIEKDHGRIETRRYWVVDHVDSLPHSERWEGLRTFGIVEATRERQGRSSTERRAYISSMPLDAKRFARSVRTHWEIENRLHWCLDVVFNEDQIRARVKNAAQNLAVIRRIALNLLRQDKKTKVGLKAKRFIAANSETYLPTLLGLTAV